MKDKTQELKSEHEAVLRAARAGLAPPHTGQKWQRAAEGLTPCASGAVTLLSPASHQPRPWGATLVSSGLALWVLTKLSCHSETEQLHITSS